MDNNVKHVHLKESLAVVSLTTSTINNKTINHKMQNLILKLRNEKKTTRSGLNLPVMFRYKSIMSNTFCVLFHYLSVLFTKVVKCLFV